MEVNGVTDSVKKKFVGKDRFCKLDKGETICEYMPIAMIKLIKKENVTNDSSNCVKIYLSTLTLFLKVLFSFFI